MITLEQLQSRHAELIKAREAHQRESREKDLGFAYALGEIERLLKLLEPPAEVIELEELFQAVQE
jgi:hypothetical protein